jgi:ABC-type sulfate/molybdate transport systems ATPase subunit
MTMTLRLQGLTRRTPTRTVLEGINLELREGEVVTLLGASGSGRATLLRIIAGLEAPDSGRIYLDGADITRLPPARRRIGLVVRHDALFRHPTVFESVAAALPPREEGGPAGAEAVGARVQRLLALAGLTEESGWLPATLSPAQRQRLALARALATEPRLLLVDAAAGASEAGDRAQPRRWLRSLHARLGLSMLVVARNAAEALSLGERVAVLRDGRLEQLTTPAELRRRPASVHVVELLGEAVPLPASAARALQLPPMVVAQLRPEEVEVVEPGLGTPAHVVASTVFGPRLRVTLRLLADGSRLEAEMPAPALATMLPPGALVGLRLRQRAARPA